MIIFMEAFIMTTLYRAKDGTEFTIEKDCIIYEKKLDDEYKILDDVIYIRNNKRIKIQNLTNVQQKDLMYIPPNNYTILVLNKYINKIPGFGMKDIKQPGHYVYKEADGKDVYTKWFYIEERCKELDKEIEELKQLKTMYQGFIQTIDTQSLYLK